jgi:hypothetical protein
MARSKSVHFLARCPQCGHLSTQTCERTALTRNVESARVELACVSCERKWQAGWYELAGIKRMLGEDALVAVEAVQSEPASRQTSV